jgi:hypothetical protein
MPMFKFTLRNSGGEKFVAIYSNVFYVLNFLRDAKKWKINHPYRFYILWIRITGISFFAIFIRRAQISFME